MSQLPKIKNTKKLIDKTIIKAALKYNMFCPKDRIILAISGGSDSMLMADALLRIQSYLQVDLTFFPVHINVGYTTKHRDNMLLFFKDKCKDLRFEEKNFGILANSKENFKNPCFLCSYLRRKTLFEIAEELDCNKIALGHHKDDFIETFFLNLFYAGKAKSMNPNQSFFKDKIKIIRPLVFLTKKKIKNFTQTLSIPEFENFCPNTKINKRAEIKQILSAQYKKNKHIKSNIFNAIEQSFNHETISN